MITREERKDHLSQVQYKTDSVPMRLKEALEESGVSKKTLQADGVSALARFNNYIYGTTLPRSTTLRDLCMYLNVSADYILGLTDEKRSLW